MKGLNKIIASAAAASVIGLQIPVMAVNLPEEIKGTKYEEPVRVLSALNMMVGDTNGELRLNDTIKRSEVTKLVVHAMGLDSQAESAKNYTSFPDVATDYWAVGYINVAKSHGWVIGDDKGTFRPESRITYAEAMTIFVRATGYEPVALSKGGYPYGYTSTADENGLSDNVSGAIREGITRGNVAILVNNALTTKLMERRGFGQNESYEITEKTLLKDKMEVDKLKGQIVAVENTSLDGSPSLKKGQVKIGDIVYESAHNLSDLLGYNVWYYVKENDAGKDEVLTAIPEKGSNTTEEISADLFEKLGEKNSYKTIEFYKTENASKTTSASLEKDATLIYNGKSETMSDDLINMKDKAGYIKLLDTDKNGRYDIVFVTDYYNMFVDEVTATKKIVDKYNAPTIKLDDEDDNLSFVIMNGVQEITLDDIQEYDVLSVAASLDKQVYEITLSRESVSGKITGTDDEGVYIDGKHYKIANNYKGDLNMNTEAKFYLDVFGKIAGVDKKSVQNNSYAYLIRAYTNTNTEKSSLKIFDSTGKESTLELNEKIRFNGQSSVRHENAVKELIKGGETLKQLITYSTNADGKITAINTAVDNSSTGAVNEDKFTMNANISDAEYNEKLNKLGNIKINSETIIFDIQKDTKDYSIAELDMFEDGQRYNIMAFDMGENFVAKAIVVTGAEFITNAESKIAVVDKISSVTNNNDETVDKLYAYKDSKPIEVLAAEYGLLSKLKTGDVIQYKVNSDGEIVTFRTLLNINEKNHEKQENPAENLEIVYGKVVKKFAGSVNVSVNNGEIQNFKIGDDVAVYSVDTTKTKNKVSVASKSDIQPYDEDENNRLLIKIYKDEVQEVVIIK